MNTNRTGHALSLGASAAMCIASQTLATPHWGLRSTSGPSPRTAVATAYDVARGVTVLFGGRGGVSSGETWEWDGSNWTLRSSSGPSGRHSHAMAWHTSREVTVLFGGYTSTHNGDTWEWNGTAWTLRATIGPAPRSEHAMIYDVARDETVLFGGDNGAFNGETWSFGERAGAIPTLSEYGMLAMGSLLLSAGGIVLLRRCRAAA